MSIRKCYDIVFFRTWLPYADDVNVIFMHYVLSYRTKHTNDLFSDAMTVIAFLKTYGLDKEYKVWIFNLAYFNCWLLWFLRSSFVSEFCFSKYSTVFSLIISLFININNLWDVDYFLIERRPMPGRMIRLGINLKYKKFKA